MVKPALSQKCRLAANFLRSAHCQHIITPSEIASRMSAFVSMSHPRNRLLNLKFSQVPAQTILISPSVLDCSTYNPAALPLAISAAMAAL